MNRPLIPILAAIALSLFACRAETIPVSTRTGMLSEQEKVTLVKAIYMDLIMSTMVPVEEEVIVYWGEEPLSPEATVDLERLPLKIAVTEKQPRLFGTRIRMISDWNFRKGVVTVHVDGLQDKWYNSGYEAIFAHGRWWLNGEILLSGTNCPEDM